MRIIQTYDIRVDTDDGALIDPTLRSLIRRALRWHPPQFDDIPDVRRHATPRGLAALIDLREGNAVTPERLQAALALLHAAADLYTSSTSEPYDGRNEEAAADMRELFAALTDELACVHLDQGREARV